LTRAFRFRDRAVGPDGQQSGTIVRCKRFRYMKIRHSLLLLLVMSGAANAQAPLAAESPLGHVVPAPSSDCTAAARGSALPEGSTTGQSTEPLSDKLAKSNGVLCPPSDVDPEIRAPTPRAGETTPVIPPPGGNPNLQPK